MNQDNLEDKRVCDCCDYPCSEDELDCFGLCEEYERNRIKNLL